MIAGMVDREDISDDPRRAAADLLRAVLEELPAVGARDTALRSKVEQRAAALDDVADFQVERNSD